jgi:histone acetyltransferase (RNA polymerase elongator complex component)
MAFPGETEIRNTIDTFLKFPRAGRKPVEIAFFGGNFLGLDAYRIKMLLGLATEYVTQGKAHGIRFSTRPDTINRQTLALAAAYPITSIELGVQSMNDRVLDACQRGHSSQHSRDAVALLKNTSYALGLQIMVGLPGASETEPFDTGRHLVELAPDFVRIYPTLVLEGSPLAQWHAHGRYTPMGLENCVQVVKSLYLMFIQHRIRVIRMGLQPTTELNAGAAVKAGPFHPAFGELVLASVFQETVISHLRSHEVEVHTLNLTVHPRNLSRLIGHRRANLIALQTRFGFEELHVGTNRSLGSDTILVNSRPCQVPT